ncbi:MAG: response regulator transcription factor [Candidatus Riflebacteria bacterium]|nr:response regulator transcription factor [Candidatus Riflebacteria bacterium]
MQETRVLLVEDDRNIALTLERTLGSEGYEVKVARDGRSAREQFALFKPDLVVLDWMLPDVDGLEVLRWLRERGRIPVLMLTARDDIADKVLGLESGADDYMTKPFHSLELVARIRSLIRRTGPAETRSGRLVYGPIEIDVAERRVTVAGTLLDLTRIEFDLIHYFVANPRIVLTRESLLQAVWGYDFEGYQRTVDTHIRRLRTKLEPQPDHPRFIHTVRGVGYRLEVEEPSGKAP